MKKLNKVTKVVALGFGALLVGSFLAGCQQPDTNSAVEKQLEAIKIQAQQDASKVAELTKQLAEAKASVKVVDETKVTELQAQLDAKTNELEEQKARDEKILADFKVEIEKLKTLGIVSVEAGNEINVDTKAYFGDSSNPLELNEFVSSSKDSFTELELSGLAGGTLRTNEGSTDYHQYLRFEDSGLKVVFGDDNNDKVNDYLFVQDGDLVFQYELEFEESLRSSIDSGAAIDMEDSQLNVLGEDWTIAKATVDTTTKTLRLTLLRGTITDTLEEGESKVYTISDKDYTVEPIIISNGRLNEEVKFNVDGYLTRALKVGATDTLPDGTLIGVREIMTNEAGELRGDLVEFYLGAHRIEFEDKLDDGSFSKTVKIDNRRINEAEVMMSGTMSTSSVEVSNIKYNLYADGVDGDVYVTKDQKLSTQVRNNVGLLSEKLDVGYEGLTDKASTKIKFNEVGRKQYMLNFNNRNGVNFDVPLVSNYNGVLNFGDDRADRQLWFTEGTSASNFVIAKKNTFVLTNKNTDLGDTNIMEYTSIDETNKLVTFTDLGTGEQKVVTYEGTPGTNAIGTLIMSGHTYKFYVGSGTDYKLVVDLNADGLVNSARVNAVVQGGGLLDFGLTNTPNSTVNLTLTTLSKKFGDKIDDQKSTILITKQGEEVDLSVTGVEFLRDYNSNDIEVAVDKYGAKYKIDSTRTNAPADLIIDYPLSQRTAKVFVEMKK